MPIRNALASLAVNNLESSIEWYEKVLGRAPDSRPMPGLAEWKFPEGGWLQVYLLPERAGKGSLTLDVTDADAQAERVRSLGVDVGSQSSNEQFKTFMIKDPDGNSIAFAQSMK